MYYWWCTSLEDVPLMEFTYLVSIRGTSSEDVLLMMSIIWGRTSHGVYVPCIYQRYILSLRTLYLSEVHHLRMYYWWCTSLEDVPLMEFTYLVSIRGTSFENVPLIMHIIWGWEWWWSRASCPRMSADMSGTNCDQCRSSVQYGFTSTEATGEWFLLVLSSVPPCEWSGCQLELIRCSVIILAASVVIYSILWLILAVSISM